MATRNPGSTHQLRFGSFSYDLRDFYIPGGAGFPPSTVGMIGLPFIFQYYMKNVIVWSPSNLQQTTHCKNADLITDFFFKLDVDMKKPGVSSVRISLHIGGCTWSSKKQVPSDKEFPTSYSRNDGQNDREIKIWLGRRSPLEII